MNEEFGFDWYNYGFRMYDASLERFPSVDPIADQFAFVSPFNYAENSPIANIDLWGLQKWGMQIPDQITKDYIKNTGKDLEAYNKAKREGNATGAGATLDIMPGVGDIKGLIEVFTNRDMVTGEKIGWTRFLGLVALSELRHLGKAKAGIGAGSKIVGGYTSDLVKGVNKLGGCENCGSVAIAVDKRLKGNSNAMALADNATSKYGVDDNLKKLFGNAEIKTSLGKFGDITDSLKPGQTGIVTIGIHGTKNGHAFNIANIGGDIRILDGQQERIFSGGADFKSYLSQWPEKSRVVKFYNTTNK